MKAAMALCSIFFYGFGWGRPDKEKDPEGHSPSMAALRQVWLPALLGESWGRVGGVVGGG